PRTLRRLHVRSIALGAGVRDRIAQVHTEPLGEGVAVAWLSLKRHWVCMLLVAGMAWGSPRAAAADLLRLTQNIAGDAQPIVVSADDVVTWNRGSQRVLLLKGNVLVEQGVIHARMRTGVAWVDLESQQKTGILRAEFYAEGDVRLENGADSQSGPKALLDLN